MKYAKFPVTHLENICAIWMEFFFPLLLFTYPGVDRARNLGKIVASEFHRLGCIPDSFICITRFEVCVCVC